MIFASFGNSPVQFVRMAEAVEKYAKESGEEVIVQGGLTRYEYKYCKCIPFMDKQTFISHLKKCEVAIMQGGWGSISEASDMGVRTVIMPRRNGVEHHHDQEQLVRVLEQQGVCLGCYDETKLNDIIEKARSFEYKKIIRGSAAPFINEFLNNL